MLVEQKDKHHEPAQPCQAESGRHNPQIFDDKPDLLHILRRYMDLSETPKRSNG
jgi:hypothetical protein